MRWGCNSEGFKFAFEHPFPAIEGLFVEVERPGKVGQAQGTEFREKDVGGECGAYGQPVRLLHTVMPDPAQEELKGGEGMALVKTAGIGQPRVEACVDGVIVKLGDQRRVGGFVVSGGGLHGGGTKGGGRPGLVQGDGQRKRVTRPRGKNNKVY